MTKDTILAELRQKILETETNLQFLNSIITELSAAPQPGPVGPTPWDVPFDLLSAMTTAKLTLPIDSTGGFTMAAKEIKRPLLDSYVGDYFYARDGWVHFECPAEGARTSGSTYPRCELRQMTESNTLAAWAVEDGFSLFAKLKVLQTSKTLDGKPGPLVFSQVHGASEELFRTYWRDGNVTYNSDKATDQKGGTSTSERTFQLLSPGGLKPTIPLGEEFEHWAVVANGKLEIGVEHRGVAFTFIETISPYWRARRECYGKAGLYNQTSTKSTAGTQGTGTAVVAFSALSWGK